MTDLGSITYDCKPDLNKIDEEADTTKVEINFPPNPRSFHSKPHGIARKQQSRQPNHPPTIVEAYSLERYEEGLSELQAVEQNNVKSIAVDANNTKELGEMKNKAENKIGDGIGNRSLKRTKAVVESESHGSVESEKKFGSGDLLTDNDSLDKEDKIGYTNVIADITVHDTNVADNVIDKLESGAQGDISVCSSQCNKSVEGQKTRESANNHFGGRKSSESVPDSKTRKSDTNIVTTESTVSVDEIDVDVEESVQNRTIEMSLSIDEIDTAAIRNVDIEKIESQIIQNGSNEIHGVGNVSADTDCNKNRTKSSVSFKEKADGEIQEETIVPVHSIPIEGKPKKDAAMKRETWASRKLKKTFGLKQKHEDEDLPDGKGMSWISKF